MKRGEGRGGGRGVGGRGHLGRGVGRVQGLKEWDIIFTNHAMPKGEVFAQISRDLQDFARYV